jgi:hypothetical protein
MGGDMTYLYGLISNSRYERHITDKNRNARAGKGILFIDMKKSVATKENGDGESGSRGFFSSSPHNTPHAGPHGAFHRDYRAVAG